MTCDRDLAFRLADHRGVKLGFGGIQAGQALLGMDPIYTDEHHIHKEPAYRSHCAGPDKRKPISAQMSAGDEYVNVLAIAEFHRNIHGIRHHREPADVVQAAHDLDRCGSGRQSDGIAWGNVCGCGLSNTPLFVRKAPHLILE